MGFFWYGIVSNPITTAVDRTANLEEKVETNIRRHDEVMISANNAPLIDRIGS
jgi:hypothetical protein